MKGAHDGRRQRVEERACAGDREDISEVPLLKTSGGGFPPARSEAGLQVSGRFLPVMMSHL